MPRFIQIPDDIQIVDPETGRPLSEKKCSFYDWIGSATILDNPVHFGQNGVDGLRAVKRIDAAVSGKRPGAVVVLDVADWTRLCNACNDPGENRSFGRPRIAVQLMTFYDAILDASETDPREQ